MKDSGFEAMVASSHWLESVTGIQIISIGHSAWSKNEAEMELVGQWFSYWASIKGTRIWISVRTMDNVGDNPDLWFSLPDGPRGWTDLRRFVQSLERSGLKTLQPRPITIGPPEGPSSFLIA
jgi:hypothetical protein